MTAIIQCTCKHEFQDNRYGPGKRLHNELGVPKDGNHYRCTVCGKLHK